VPELNETSALNSDNELEKSKQGIESIQDQLPQPIPGDLNAVGNINKRRKKIYLAGVFITILGFFLGGCLIIMYKPIKPIEKNIKEYRFVIPKGSPVLFNAFVIPLKRNHMFTYILIDMAFNIREEILRKEIMEKKTELRGMIYDTLYQEINRTEMIPSVDALKTFVLQGVNSLLSVGKIDNVYVSQYLAV